MAIPGNQNGRLTAIESLPGCATDVFSWTWSSVDT